LTIRKWEVALSAERVIGHKFKIGQIVHFRPKSRSQSFAPSQPFQITARLPKNDGEFQYRIKGAYEEHERVAVESELSRALAR
jgi:hypothetical protein